MRKHEYAKVDCNCARRATNFQCKHCGNLEYASKDEIKRLSVASALCSAKSAPSVAPAEKFSGLMGGTFDCLAEDYEGFFKKQNKE